MSFILDALKKSENERQRKTPAEFATVPRAPDAGRAPRWLWVLGGLLAVNIAVVGLALFKKSGPATLPTQTAAERQGATAETDTAGFRARVEQARLQRPAGPAAGTVAETLPGSVARTGSGPVPGSTGPRPRDDGSSAANPAPDRNFALLPSLAELRANGTLQLPDLHVDIHVFSDAPSDRFVFINMNKYRERDRLAEGPVVREITRDGVVLDDDGTAFVLLRD